jgi:hypothetical protein
MMSYLYASDMASLQAVCDSWFGPVAEDGEYRYEPLSPVVVVTFADYQGARPLSLPYTNWGVAPYHEVIYSFFVVRLKKTAGVWLADRVGSFVPYIFVDDSIAMVAGREVYGMPKNIGWIEMPPTTDATDYQLRLETVTTPEFTPGRQFTRLAITEINSTGVTLGEIWNDVETAYAALRDLIFGAHHLHLPDLNLIIELADAFKDHELPFCSFRQTLSVENSTDAVYQAAVDLVAHMDNFHTGGLLHGTHQLKLPQNALFPIADSLGLHDGQLALAAFTITWDFTFTTGTTIWSRHI